MAKFNAAEAVEDLEYDFTKYVDGCVGVVPEPSSDQMDAFFKSLQDTAKSVKGLRTKVQKAKEEDMSDEEMQALLDEMDDIQFGDFTQKMVEAAGEVCSNQPSAEQIGQLPHRVQQSFLKWLMEAFRPEGEATTTKV